MLMNASTVGLLAATAGAEGIDEGEGLGAANT
jgi:hypothetical protein